RVYCWSFLPRPSVNAPKGRAYVFLKMPPPLVHPVDLVEERRPRVWRRASPFSGDHVPQHRVVQHRYGQQQCCQRWRKQADYRRNCDIYAGSFLSGDAGFLRGCIPAARGIQKEKWNMSEPAKRYANVDFGDRVFPKWVRAPKRRPLPFYLKRPGKVVRNAIRKWISTRRRSAHISRAAGLGDVLMCTPAMRALKQANPRCRIH